MDNTALKPIFNGAVPGTKKDYVLVMITGALMALTACGGRAVITPNLAPPPPVIAALDMAGAQTPPPLSGDVSGDIFGAAQHTGHQLPPLTMADTAAFHPLQMAPTTTGGENLAGCSLRDRFDRSAALAYHFKDNQNVLGLKLGISGPAVNRAMFRFTHHFQDKKVKKAHCRKQGPWQGLIPTGVHELAVRDQQTIWQALRDRTADFFSP
jgi:hypothetical protein